MVNTLVLILLVAAALLAFAVRRNAILCLAALIFVPALPAGLQELLSSPVAAGGGGDLPTRFLVLGIVCYGGVWGGFITGLLFDRTGAVQARSRLLAAGRDGDDLGDRSTPGAESQSDEGSTTHNVA